MTIGKG